jgi:hypothetical protein
MVSFFSNIRGRLILGFGSVVIFLMIGGGFILSTVSQSGNAITNMFSSKPESALLLESLKKDVIQTKEESIKWFYVNTEDSFKHSLKSYVDNFDKYRNEILVKSENWNKSNIDSLKKVLLHLDTAVKQSILLLFPFSDFTKISLRYLSKLSTYDFKLCLNESSVLT